MFCIFCIYICDNNKSLIVDILIIQLQNIYKFFSSYLVYIVFHNLT